MFKTILVDDDPWALVDIKSCFPFESCGFRVVAECASAESALPTIMQYRPELVITDIRMGSGSGLDLISKCRAQDILSLFIILSGYDRFEYAKEAIKLGAYYYMLKPINDSEAQTVMRQAAQHLLNHEPLPEAWGGSGESDAMQNMLNYIDVHSSEDINLSRLSKAFFLNRTYICDLFRKKTGRTLREHLHIIRIGKACRLLSGTAMPIGSVAHRVGFEDTHYFSRVFKTVMNMTPLAYRIQQNQKSKPVIGLD
jgi:YesN/AraC family two-component response regulator